MPWEVRNAGSGSRPYCVFKKGTSEQAGCHTTRAKAQAQVRALYAADASLEEFNALVIAAHEYGDSLEAELAAVYRKAFRKRGKKAAQKMRTLGIQASAMAPAPAELYEGFGAKEREELAAEQQKVAERVAEILLIPLGLGFLAATFLDVMLVRSIETFDDAAIREIQAIVQEGLDSGLTISEIAGALIAAFEGGSASTAEMLARTHITAITNESSLVAARGVAGEKPVYKMWATMRDPRVRLPHSRVEGQTKPLDSPFEVGGFYLMYPGDPSGPIAMTANCRCVLTYTRALLLTASASTLPGVDVEALEQELAGLAAELEPEPVVAGVVQTDAPAASLKERFEAYELGMKLGVLSQNDCLRFEGREPVEGGDVRAVLGQPAPQSDNTLRLVVGEEMSDSTASILNAITERMAAGEQLTAAMLSNLRDLSEMQANPPTVIVEPPNVTVQAPNVTVEAPNVTVEAPNVTVEPPAVTVEVDAPQVVVTPQIVMPSEQRSVTFERDAAGRLTGATIEDE